MTKPGIKLKAAVLATFAVAIFSCPVRGFAEEEKKEAGEKKELPEWVEVQAQISSLNAKIQAKKETIRHLIEEKHELPANSPRVKSIIEEMVSEHKELQGLEEEYNKQLTIFKYRFPERGAKENRKYAPAEVKSLDQMEQELNIEGRLNRNMKKLRSQYGAGKEDKPTALKSEKTAEETLEKKLGEKPADQKSIEDSDSVILKK